MKYRQDGIPLWWLAFITGLIPLVTTHLTFAVSVLEGFVELCNPYWDSCTSISRTGRYGTAYFIFKGTMLPGAAFGIAFWWLNRRWLLGLGANARGINWLPILGVVGGLSLAAYTLALGHGGESFSLVRRVGVVLYFSLTYIAQLVLSGALREHPVWQDSGRRLLWLCEFTLAVGILTVLLDAFVPEFYDRRDDAFEWLLALLLNIHALWVARLWCRSRFRARLRVG